MVLNSFVAIRGLLVGKEEVLRILAAEDTWTDVLKFLEKYSFLSHLPTPKVREIIKYRRFGDKMVAETPELSTREERLAYLKSYLDWATSCEDEDETEFFSMLCEFRDLRFVHTWRCCSELNHKKFILGEELPFIQDIWKMNESIVTLDSVLPQGFDDEEILEDIRAHGITVERWQLQTFILPDDCSPCS